MLINVKLKLNSFIKINKYDISWYLDTEICQRKLTKHIVCDTFSLFYSYFFLQW